MVRMTRDDSILFAAAMVRLKRSAASARLAFDRFGLAADPDRGSREVEKLIADTRGEIPSSDEVLRAGPSEDARHYADRRHARSSSRSGE